MNDTIKFSHEYYKLNVIADKIQGGKHPVTLLEVFVKKSEELSPAFTEYDTTYFDGKQIQRYKLGKGEHLILLFRDFKGNLFTTVRSRYGGGKDKLEYYSSKRGESFNIEFVEANHG
jgi:hypothetical protein